MLNEHGHDEVPEELIDLEEWAKAGKAPKPAKAYRIRIDKDKKDVTVPSMTGRQILGLVSKTPETHMLSQKMHGGAPKTIGADDPVRFDTPGIERFQTLPRDPTEG
jgi:Multiubiquitin